MVNTKESPPPRAGTDQELLEPIEAQVVELFVRGVQVLGLPRSIGEIYGLLYITPEPLAMDQLIARLRISKGSASQGLRFLRNLGAVKPQYIPGNRRDHFVAETQLKKLINGFIKGEISPHMESGDSRLDAIEELAVETETAKTAFQRERIDKLRRWQTQGSELLELAKQFIC